MPKTANNTLAAPGAGLPAPELFIARRLFALKRWKGSRETFIATFKKERSTIQGLLEECPESKRSELVLISRLRGLEDSSRNWSMWMTLDHLRITNLAFARFIKELTSGSVPDLTVSTAEVKPDPEITKAIEEEFEQSCDALLEVLKKAPDLKTSHRFPHPWFGPLDAYSWLALAAMHMGIHRGQLSAILNGLPK